MHIAAPFQLWLNDRVYLEAVGSGVRVELLDELGLLEDGVDDDEAEEVVLHLFLKRLEEALTVRLFHVRVVLVLKYLHRHVTTVNVISLHDFACMYMYKNCVCAHQMHQLLKVRVRNSTVVLLHRSAFMLQLMIDTSALMVHLL